MAGTVEAVIGAVYLDSGMGNVVEVMQNLGLIPRLIRRTGMKVQVSESVQLSAVPTSIVEDQEGPDIAPEDLDERLVKAMKSSQKLEKALWQLSIEVQLKEQLDEDAQSPPGL